MDYTSQPEAEKIARSKKMMLWFGIIGLSMMFAGLTSAYIVSKERRDWVTNFELPQAFYISTAVIVLSSITMILAKRFIKTEKIQKAKLLLGATLILGIAFVYLQFVGFDQIIANGYFFTGSQSSITTSFIYAFVITHIAHVAIGLIVLVVMTVKLFQGKYYGDNILGASLGATFWHFVDILWVYLFLFLLFFR